MKIPKKVKIGARTYTINLVKQLDPNKTDDDDFTGLTKHSQLTISIKAGKKEAMEHTFLHELFHAFHCGMDEDLVEALASFLHSFIKDNPKVFNG